MKTSDLYTAEWNNKQMMPHIQTLNRYLAESFGKALEQKPQDWILIGVFEKQEDASKFLSDYEDKIGAGEKRKEIMKNLADLIE